MTRRRRVVVSANIRSISCLSLPLLGGVRHVRASIWHGAGSLAILQCPSARIFYFPCLRQNPVLRTFVLSPVAACCSTVLRCLRAALYPRLLGPCQMWMLLVFPIWILNILQHLAEGALSDVSASCVNSLALHRTRVFVRSPQRFAP